METQPVHKSFESIPNGIKIKRFDSSYKSNGEGEILHSDEYYVFGFVESGSCEIQIDFNTVKVEAGNAVIVSPSQLHSIVSITDAEGYAMLIDNSLVSEEESKSLVAFKREETLLQPSWHIGAILSNLFSTLHSVNQYHIELSNSFRVYIGQAIIGVFCSLIKATHRQQCENKRYIRHADAFFKLLEKDIAFSRRPSYFAQKMNISPVYLNEAVKGITGKSVSQIINEELMLRAKRLLVFTKMDVKEIAFKLGFNDVAYFTRLFTKTIGCSPLHFRKNLK